MLDVTRVFFNPALASERMRVARQVAGGERVLIPYAGVGPCVVPVAAMGAHVITIEASRNAYMWLVENVRRNHVEERVLPIWGDVTHILESLCQPFDRAIIPAPYGDEGILDTIISHLVPGATIHLYLFRKSHQIEGLCDRYAASGLDVISVRRCGNVAPGVSRIVLEIKTG